MKTDPEEESLLDLILSATLEGIVDHDLTAGTVDYSPRWKMLLGFDQEVQPEETAGLWLELTHDDDRAEVEDLWEGHVESGWPFRHTWRMQHHHGGYRWVLCRSVLRFDDAGEPMRAISLFTDVTEEVEEQKRHQALVEAIPDTVLRVSREGELLDLRPGSQEGGELLLGEARIGGRLEDLAAGDLSTQLGELVEAALASQELQGRDFAYVCGDATHSFEIRVTPSAEREAVCLIRDVTEVRRLEQQLLQGQKLESIGQLAAGVAHEINTPTQYVGDNTRFLQDSFTELVDLLEQATKLVETVNEGKPAAELASTMAEAFEEADVEYLLEEVPGAIEQSLGGIDRIAKIVRSMKEFSHPGVEEFTAVDLNRSIESTVTVATSEWKYVAEMDLQLDEALPNVKCLAGEFNQVVLNIIVNASHAIGDVVEEGTRGKITISTRPDGEFVEIRIADTGGGMPEEICARIFDPFFTTKGVGKGTGQGLAIAHGVVVQKHGGTIDVETEVGVGTTFIIRLPIHQAEATEEAEAA